MNNQVQISHRADGSILVKPQQELGPYPETVGEMYARSVQRCADSLFLLERNGEGQWNTLSYAQSWDQVRAIAQALLNRGADIDHPVMVLSGNSTEHALLKLAAIQVGVPLVPVSPAWSLLSTDYAKLKHVVTLIQPVIIFVQSTQLFSPALAALELENIEVLTANNDADNLVATDWSTFLDTKPGHALEQAAGQVCADTVAKYLFTSGSTGMPKAVINTHRMLCSNQQALLQTHPVLAEAAPVIVDWLPWHHTFGGNHNFNLVLNTGGTLYIDNGKPLPGKFDESIRNLEEISPTVYFNVPAGFQMLIERLESSSLLRETFFKNLKLIYYAAAALPQPVFDRLNDLSYQTLGHRVPVTTGYGATETAPLATSPLDTPKRSISIGLPVPGTTLKLAAVGDKMEIRLKGPNITPGYLHDPEKTASAFDEEGFYRMGDAARFLDPDKSHEGLYFDGRLTEDFKLMTGSWVSVGSVRIALISAAAPLIKDLVITGHDRNFLGALVWLNNDACRKICETPSRDDASLAEDKQVLENLRTAIQSYNLKNNGSSSRVKRIIILTEPPSADKNEITDKGYINQSAVLANRAELVEQLYADTTEEHIIEI